MGKLVIANVSVGRYNINDEEHNYNKRQTMALRRCWFFLQTYLFF